MLRLRGKPLYRVTYVFLITSEQLRSKGLAQGANNGNLVMLEFEFDLPISGPTTLITKSLPWPQFYGIVYNAFVKDFVCLFKMQPSCGYYSSSSLVKCFKTFTVLLFEEMSMEICF